ncbi:AT-hook motif nuclear-localized protein [Psidium guajava]|nr:AT-hook motif nuclear-localized protein [Psidium guajava]
MPSWSLEQLPRLKHVGLAASSEGLGASATLITVPIAARAVSFTRLPVTGCTKATLTPKQLQEGQGWDTPSECDNQFHSDGTLVVALFTRWYHDGKRFHKEITIHGNRRTDSTMGCDKDHDFQPPCPNNIVDASKAVWKALGAPESG